MGLRTGFGIGLGEPDLDGELVLAGGDRLARERLQTGGMKPALHFAIGKAKAAMGEIAAQEFKVVRC
jgi:hypothetical protein